MSEVDLQIGKKKAQSVNSELIAPWDLSLKTDQRSSDSAGGDFAATEARLDCF